MFVSTRLEKNNFKRQVFILHTSWPGENVGLGQFSSWKPGHKQRKKVLCRWISPLSPGHSACRIIPHAFMTGHPCLINLLSSFHYRHSQRCDMSLLDGFCTQPISHSRLITDTFSNSNVLFVVVVTSVIVFIIPRTEHWPKFSVKCRSST